MKTLIKFSVILNVFLIALISFPLQGKTVNGIQKTIVKECKVSASTLIRFKNSNGSLMVATWDKDQVKMETMVTIDGESDDVNTVLKAIDQIGFSESGSLVAFDTRFYEQWRQQGTGNITLTLSKNSKVKISKLSVSYVLTIPKNNPLDLTNKYGDVVLPDLNGKLILDLYEVKLTAGIIANEATVDLKYGGGSFMSVKDIDLSLYEVKLKIGQAGKMDIKSKYSTLEVQEAAGLKIDSYEGNITIHKHGDVSVTGKYTDFFLSDFTKGIFDLYEGSLTAGTGNDVTLTSLYTKIGLQSVKTIQFPKLYQSEIKMENAGSVTGESQYGHFEINRLDDKLEFNNSYEDHFVIGIVNKNFNRIKINGKYTTLEAPIESGAKFKVIADLTYANIVLPDNQTINTSKKSDEHWAFTGYINGSEGTTTSTVELTLYEGKAVLK